MSSDEDDNDDFNEENDEICTSSRGASGITSAILFGNIDKDGNLVDDIFDEECKKQLNSLQPHLLSVVGNLIDDEDEDEEGDEKDDIDSASNSEINGHDVNYSVKNDSAVDYSDINEFVEDDRENFIREMNELRSESKPRIDDDDDYDDDEKPDSNEEHFQKDKDGFTIPKPLRRDACGELSAEEQAKEYLENRKRLDTPLAAMLPSKYADFDVTELFPEFRHNKVLRFSRLFGPGKATSLPQIWKSVKNKRKSKHALENKHVDHVTAKYLQEKDWDYNATPLSEISPDMIELDDEIKLLKNDFTDKESRKKFSSANDENLNVADWRYGPAQIWYDMLKVPENGEGFDYGFKIKPKDENEDEEIETKPTEPVDPDDAFHLVTQLQWENDIIWNPDEIRQKILAKLNDKHLASGWLPSGDNRTATAFTQQIRATTTTTAKPVIPTASMKKSDKKNAEANLHEQNQDDKTCYSIFPIENEELIYSFWEKDIIWDAEAMSEIPNPKILTLDRNDENIVLEVPSDTDPNEAKTNVPAKEKKDQIRKSRLLLGKAGVIAEPEVVSPPTTPSDEKEPLNISNDEYYRQKTTTAASLKSNTGNLIQHSIPALELRQPFFPTHLNYQRLRGFHRPSLKRHSHGAIADTLPHGVNPLVKHIKRKAKLREQERIASGGGEMFFMRTPEDLTGKDGDLILTEYSEEHPPLMSQVGMASKIKNFYRRKAGKDSGPPNFKYGETVYCHSSPFLGNLQHGQSMQALENNLFRVPIYEHCLPETDFLIIRTRDNYFIREVDTIYTVGQELPLFEVPGPNSKKSNIFIRDFLQVFIFRLFWKSVDTPRRIKMEDIKKAFPAHSESSIRKRLKQCADFKRTGMDSNWWVLKSDFRLPSEDEIRAMVSPEACCAYYSMLAAEQRLKDAGYGEKSMFAPDDAEDEDLQVKIDDEVKAAPWNTTRAFISATKGKCLLQLTGIADPSGCGEGFSYVRIPNKPQQSKEEAQKEPMPKKTVTGTDADLRRLPLNAAKQLLRKFGVPDEEIKKLSRWEVIDVVRTLSTKQAKQQGDEAGEDDAMSKFARGNRFSIAEHQERYKEECQRIFDLQNRVLASTEDLSTDDDESEEEEDSEIEELGKNIESMLANKKTIKQISRDKEEEERREMKKLFLGDESNQSNEQTSKKRKAGEKEDENEESVMNSSSGRILKIFRTYTNAAGKEFVRIETVRKSAVIDTYVRIRTTKDDAFIKQFASALDEQQKEEKRREKRRLQEQLRRLKRNQEKEKFSNSIRSQYGINLFSSNLSTSLGNSSTFGNDSFGSVKESKIKKLKKESNLKLKCGACGGVGHMRTNRACPQYKSDSTQMSADGQDEEDSGMLNEDNLVKVDETKLVLSKSVIKHLDEQKQQQPKSSSLKLKIPKDVLKKKKRLANTDSCDYLQKPDYKSANRRRTDPLVILSAMFEEVLNEMRQLPDSEPFHLPVNAKNVPDYYNIIQNPMDLQTIKQNIRDKRYKSREEFLNDISLIVKNSELYNGINHMITALAKKVMEFCVFKIQHKEDEFIKLEKVINPLLDNDQIAFSYIIKTIVSEKLKTISDSWTFHKPVNKKQVKHYYDIIKKPMDLDTLENNAATHKYKSREKFLADVELIHENSIKFNGIDSTFTKKSAQIVQIARSAIEEYEAQLIDLEKSINIDRLGLEDLDDESNMAMEYDDDDRKQTEFEEGYEDVEMDEDKSMASTVFAEKDIVADDLQMTPEHGHSGEESDVENNPWTQQQATDIYARSMVAMPPPPEEDNFDENYDPSEFLLTSSFAQQSNLLQSNLPPQPVQVEHEPVDVSRDLDVSESDEEPAGEGKEDDDDGVWF